MNTKNILIYTIVRDSEKKLDRYYTQVRNLVEKNNEYNFILSIYENDSSDDTVKKIRSYDWSFVNKFDFVSEKIKTKKYGSTTEQDRVKNLSAARNKAIEKYISVVDYILAIESDISFDSTAFTNLINFKKNNNLDNVDIVSGISWRKNKFYDAWATRRNEIEEVGNLHKNWPSRKFDKYYSTFNCLCLYKAEPFQKGLRYNWYNNRLKKHDCDTAVICEDFHQNGFHDIYIDYTTNCYQD